MRTPPAKAMLLGEFRVRPIDPKRAGPTYPLARLAIPSLSLEDWRRLLASRRPWPASPADDNAIVALEDRTGCVWGLCSMRTGPDLTQGLMTLHAELVLTDLLNARRLAAVVLEGLTRRARASDCRAIRIELPCRPEPEESGASGIAAALREAGFEAGPAIRRWTLRLPGDPRDDIREVPSS